VWKKYNKYPVKKNILSINKKEIKEYVPNININAYDIIEQKLSKNLVE